MRRIIVLTRKEQSILRVIAECDPETLKTVAVRVKMSEGTLKQHLTNIYGKFGWSGHTSLTRLVLWSHQHPECCVNGDPAPYEQAA